MLVLRLTRVGKKKEPTYRIVAQEKKRDPWGKALEILGNYNPKTKALVSQNDRIKHWISKGAQASPTLHNLLVREKIIDAPKIKVTPPPKRKDAVKTEEKAA